MYDLEHRGESKLTVISDPSADDFQPVFNSIVNQTGCASSNDTLACLRGLTYSELNSVLNSSTITAAVRNLASCNSAC